MFELALKQIALGARTGNREAGARVLPGCIAVLLALSLRPAEAALVGDFDPKVLRPSHELETPHIKWLKPCADGPLKVLFVMSQHCMREVVELAQRMDLHYQVFAVPSRPARGSFRTPPLTKEDYRRDLREKLAAPNDLIMVGVQSWQHLSLWQRYRILKKVNEGTPLLSMSRSMDEYLKRASSKHKSEPQFDAVVPFKGLPAFRESVDFATFVKTTLDVSRFGKGTITLIKPYGVTPPQAFTPPRRGGLALHMLEYDYYLAFVIQLIRQAAGREPAVAIRGESFRQADRKAIPPVEFALEAKAPMDVHCRFAVRGRDNRVLRSDERQIALVQGKNRAAFDAGRLPAGGYFADLWLMKNGAVVEFGSAFLDVTSETAIDTAQVRSSFRSDEPVAGSVALTVKPGTDGLRIEVWQRDNFGRVAARTSVTVEPADLAAKTIRFELPQTHPLSIVQYLDVALLRGDEVLDRTSVPFSISNLPPADDFRYVIWGVGQCSAATYLAYHAYQAQWDAGFDTQYTGFNPFVPLANMHHIPYATRLHPNEKAGKQAKGRDVHVRKPCLTDPEYRRKLAERLTENAERTGPYSTCEFSMGDECHFRYGHQRELCFSPTCTARFREFLKREYADLAALNQEYGTSYASFAEVEPITLSEAQKTPNLVPLWVDFRRHMESTWADIQAFCRDTIQKVVPGARVGYEGTDYDNLNSFDAFEFDKVMRIMRLNNTYDGAFSPYAVVDLSQPNTMLGTGWIGSYADYKKYHDWDSQAFNRYIPWRHLFRGANSLWVWYSCAADSGVGHGSIMAPDFSFFECFIPNFAEVREIKGGPGKLLVCAEREHDGTAILYSPSSMHTATACRLGGLMQNILRSLVPLLEDTHRQFRIISSRQLADGILAQRGFTRLFLPYAQALSEEEVEAVRAFVRQGGTVIADLRPAVCDEHGKPYPQSALDDVFGVAQDTGLRQLKQFPVTVDAPGFPADFPKTYADDSLKVATGEARGKAGEAPALVVNTFGQGKALLWNFSLHAYQRNQGVLSIEVERLLEDAPRIKAAFRSLIDVADIGAPLDISPDIYGLRAYRFRRGNLRYLGLLQHPCKAKQALAMKMGKEDPVEADVPFPQPVPAAVRLGKNYHVYDVRRAKYLGETGRIEAEIGPGRAELYSLLPYRVRRIAVKTVSQVRQGDVLSFEAAVTVGEPSCGLHVLHAHLVAPDGRQPRHYTMNLKAEAGRIAGRFHIALNDVCGRWKLVVRDVASGLETTEEISVTEVK